MARKFLSAMRKERLARSPLGANEDSPVGTKGYSQGRQPLDRVNNHQVVQPRQGRQVVLLSQRRPCPPLQRRSSRLFMREII